VSFYRDFITTLRSQIEEMTGLNAQNVIFSHQAGEPIGSYCVMTQLSLDRTSYSKTSTLTDEEEQLWITSTYEVSFRVSFLGEDAMYLSTDFDIALDNVVHLENLLRNNISVMRRGSVKYVPELRDTKWINRYVQEITFAFGAITQQDVDVIDSIEWTDPIGHTHTIP
jgi:hypothetical protein